MIRVIYTSEPRFPASDQHPDAVRYRVSGYWVDAIGGEPTPEDVAAVLAASQPQAEDRLADLEQTIKRMAASGKISGDELADGLKRP